MDSTLIALWFLLFVLIHLALRSSTYLHEFQQNTSQYPGY